MPSGPKRSSGLLLGCIADDLTGATDLALALARSGLVTKQIIGVPREHTELPDADALVVSLKSRTIAPEQAIAMSVASLRRLRAAGAQQFYFKYCSTFDSTAQGNIGPVIDALLNELKADFTIACPAFPNNGRTVYKGHLFVHGALLEQSSLKDHPLTPMRDSNLQRVLQSQSRRQVGLIPYEAVDAGPVAVAEQVRTLRQAGCEIAIVDALSDVHLEHVGAACRDLTLVTGGSALALGLISNFDDAAASAREAPVFQAPVGRTLIVAGSCSEATREQVEHVRAKWPSFRLDAEQLMLGQPVARAAVDWAASRLPTGPVLVFSSATPSDTASLERRFGREETGAAVESALAQITDELVTHEEVRRVIVAGGETSGAVVERLGLTTLSIGPEIAPGVPWTLSGGHRPLALALKSGNFGGPGFFLDAIQLLERQESV